MKKITFYKRKNCSNCTVMEKLLSTVEGIEIEYIDADENKEEVAKYGIKGTVTFPVLAMSENGVEIASIMGVAPLESVLLPLRGLEELQSMAYVLQKKIQSIDTFKTSLQAIENIISVKENFSVQPTVQ